MNVYFISGVGADWRVFSNLKLPAGCAAHHLDWIKPEINETLASYAKRLAEGIDRSKPFILVGLSFGGMLATEINALYPAKLVVLISSVPTSDQLPPYFKMAGRINLHKLVPVSLLKSMSLLKRLFTAETPEAKKFLRQAIRSADTGFIRWSLDAIVKWRGHHRPSSYIHIHGSQDFILPTRFTGYTHLVKGGGHLMVLTRASDINRILAEAIGSEEGRREK